MTEWTPEEERVARALEPDVWFNRENAFACWNGAADDVADEVVRPSIEQAKRAIAAMQPRWRDVKTDPPPRDGTPVLMAYAADGKAHLVAKYGVGAYSGDILWEWGWAMPPTHWQPITPPRPPAPETSRER